jgi:hypothetical protein
MEVTVMRDSNARRTRGVGARIVHCFQLSRFSCCESIVDHWCNYPPVPDRSGTDGCTINSGESRLRNAEQLVGFIGCCLKPIIVRAQSGDLELKSTHLGTQYRDLVDEASI